MVSVRGLPAGTRRAYSRRISTFFRVPRSPLGAREGIRLDLVGPGRHVGAWELPELADLRVREGGLSGAAPAEEVHLAHAALAEGGERVVGDVGDGELVGGAAEDAHHVHRDVAHTDHRHALLRQVEPVLAEIGVPVVPGDEVGRRVAAAKILAGDAHAPVGLGPRRVDDLVIVGPEILERHVLAELDVAEEAESGVRRRLVEGGRDVLDLLVVGRDPEADQAIGRREAVVEIHLHVEARLAEEVLRRVEAGRPRADDRDPKRHAIRSPSPCMSRGARRTGIAVTAPCRPASGACPPRRGTGRAPL
jgi:hypothetical protein